MKLGITINIGNFESLKIDSSEQDSILKCKHELLDILYSNYEAFKISSSSYGSQKSKDALLPIQRWIDIIKNLNKVK